MDRPFGAQRVAQRGRAAKESQNAKRKGQKSKPGVSLRVCDLFKFAHKSGLKTKDLSTPKWPTNQKSHKL
jgi:hypothetical protein